MPDRAIDDAIARGQETSAALIKHRDALFPHLHALLWITGSPESLRACAAGAVEAVIIASHRQDEPGEGALMDVVADHERKDNSQGRS